MNNTLNLTKMSYTNLWTTKNFLITYILIFGSMSIINPFMQSILIPMIVYIATYQIMEFEDRSNIEVLVGTLPVTRCEYIKSRYALVVGNLFLGIVVFSICFILMGLARKYFNINLYSYTLQNYETLFITGTLSACITMSVLIPSLIRFGSITGRYIAFLVFGLFVIIPVLIMPEFSDLSLKIFAINENLLIPIFLLAEILILSISFIISNKIYKKK